MLSTCDTLIIKQILFECKNQDHLKITFREWYIFDKLQKCVILQALD